MGSCSFFVLNHPLPYCCFLGRTRRREFLGQLICSCVWSSSRLQAIPGSSSVFQDLAHFFFSLQNLPVAGLPSPRPGVICRLWELPRHGIRLGKLQPSQTFSSSSLPRVHPLHAPRRYKLHSEVERNTLDLSDVPTARWDTMLSQQFALAEAPPIIPRARRGALGRRRPLWVQERDYCRRVSRRGFRQPDPKWRLADVLLA